MSKSAGQEEFIWFCEGCNKEIPAHEVVRAGVNCSHSNPDKPEPYLLNCSPVRPRKRAAKA